MKLVIVRLIKKKKIYNFNLPTIISGNYWITDTDFLGNSRNLINVEEENGKWKIKSDFETKIMSGQEEIESAYLENYSIYFLKVNTDNEYVILYCSPSYDTDSIRLRPRRDGEILIANDNRSAINYSFPLVSKQHARLFYNNKKWVVQDLNSKYGTYVNNIAVTTKELEYGDIIFIMGLKIVVMPDYILINNVLNYVKFDNNAFEIESSITQSLDVEDNPDEEQVEFYKEDDYFYRAPRFKTMIEDANITIDAPPGMQKEDDTPAIYTIGPMLTMGMMSMTMVYTSLSGVIDGTKDLKSSAPALVMASAMLGSMLLWPLLQRGYKKRKRAEQEKVRQIKYKEYVDQKRKDIQTAMNIQRQILIDNYLPLQPVEEIITKKKRSLWERELDQEDFLTVRLGIGSTELQGSVAFPQEHFSLEEDNLLQEVYKLGAESRTLEGVPVALSLIKNRISAIIGTAQYKQKFIEGLLLQILAYHSYADLKIVVLTDETKEDNWSFLKIAPHNWSNDRMMRFFATNLDEAKQISLYLEKEFQGRKNVENNDRVEISEKDYHYYVPYYIIFTDNYKEYRDLDLLKDVCESPINYGFSLSVISPRLINLPNECETFISIGDKKSGVFENELASNKQKEFVADYDNNLNMNQMCKILANIPIDIAKESRTLPSSITFLEMYNVGMVEQLNILNRWKMNDPTKSLQVPIGLDKSQELLKLDLHEKAHGPHGLIAGMTGSGKSEFITTYIVSLALNYHPYEVSFVLIDYKGGGLTGVFENKETGFKLPHLAGTITNLDTIELNRSLASIQSELRRRQRVFNEARDKLNESTIDIYKYQSLYRRGLVDTPVSHLFIISDEFAELKDQQPEFMDQLISTARIGRSLGVHLILATQKPAGIVNDQIWSNSRFRICLKVQDRSDSMDMIKVPDAAELKDPGRFYLQVGYNELFALGQAAWAGAQYYPQEKRKKKVDKSIDIVDNVGTIVKSLEDHKNDIRLVSQGEEITNIVKYIVDTAKSKNISIDRLWLDRIPNEIYTNNLKIKYAYHSKRNVINPIIGEYDDPDNQKQDVLTLPLSEKGNTIVFGSAGSGKELMMESIVYSIITSHSPSEVNLYLMDFGAETLSMFRDAPQVGEVLLSNDSEKITNLFKMIDEIVEERKKLFIDYNGSYNFYISHSGQQIPTIIVMINNYESFIETYPDFEETIQQLTRDCLKYGILFVFSTSGPTTMRYKLRQNFSQNIVLQFNDSSDYGSVLPGVRRKEPSKVFGRGLVAIDNGIYEFQTAYPYKDDKKLDYIRIVCEKLNSMFPEKAYKIPVLPEVVSQEFVKEKLGSLETIPVGVKRDTLDIATINLEKSYMYLITGDDVSQSQHFVKGLVNNFLTIDKSKVIMLDAGDLVADLKNNDKIIYSSGDCLDGFEKLKEIYNNKIDKKDDSMTICLISNIKLLTSKFDTTTRTKFTTLVSQANRFGTMKFIVIDTIDAIKGLTYEPWLRSSVDFSEGVWLGNGISNQFTLKVTTASRILRKEIPDSFAYIVEKGKASVIKLMSDK